MSTDKKHIEITNAGPQHHFEADLKPGMNIFTGANESGKSSLLDVIALAGGETIDVDSLVSDGQTKGYLKLDGTMLVEFTRSRTKKGELDASLASVSSLALAINPGIKDRDRAETRRLTEILTMFELKTDREVIRALVETEDEDITENAIDYLEESLDFEEMAGIDPVAAAQKVKRQLELKKREAIGKAQEAQGRWQATHPESKPEKLSELTVEKAQTAYDAAVGDHRQTQGSAEQRVEREAERVRISANHGTRPDVLTAGEELVAAEDSHETAGREVARIQQQIAVLQAQSRSAEELKSERLQQAGSASVRLRKVESDAGEWDRQKAILAEKITGATSEDVERAAAGVQAARSELELARTTAEYRKNLEASEAARRERESYEKMAGQYDTLAQAVPSKLGGLLNQAGMPKELSVDDGILTYTRPGGHPEPFHRLSDGARTRILLPIWTKKNPGKLAAFPRVFWFDLEDESKIEVAQALEEFGVIGCTEIATRRGEGIAVEHFEAKAIKLEGAGVAQEAAKKPRMTK